MAPGLYKRPARLLELQLGLHTTKIKTLFSPIADVLTNETFKQPVVTPAPLSTRAGGGGAGTTCAMAWCHRLRRGQPAPRHARDTSGRKALAFLSSGGWCGEGFKLFHSSRETLYEAFPRQTRGQTQARPAQAQHRHGVRFVHHSLASCVALSFVTPLLTANIFNLS